MIEIPYFAGIFDASALFRTRVITGGTLLPVVQVHGLPVPMLEVLAEATGTKVITVRRDYHRAPCSDHCTDRHNHVLSVTGRWSLTGAKATVVIAAVLPYLRVQHKEAREVLEVGLVAPRKAASFGKMADLGWPLPTSPDTLRLVTPDLYQAVR